MDQLIALDHEFFHWINHGWEHPWLDVILPWWRTKTSWIPAYLLAIAWLIYHHRQKGFYYLLALALTIGLADQLSSQVIKKSVERPRPCRELSLQPAARTLVHCGGGFSFTSSHATNHFAVALFLFLGWARSWGRWRWLLPLWAAIVALAQVYVGVHYPLDIVAGTLLGISVGTLGAYLYARFAKAHRIDAWYSRVPGGAGGAANTE
jgi:undecaprenyl-diphosphatase